MIIFWLIFINDLVEVWFWLEFRTLGVGNTTQCSEHGHFLATDTALDLVQFTLKGIANELPYTAATLTT